MENAGAPRRSDEERLQRRRERCKINQRKYRANLRVSKNLERLDMEELGRVNQRLEGHIDAIDRLGLWCHAEEQSLLEYLRLFEHGYSRSERQDAFLRFFVDPDGWCNDQRGVEVVRSMWTSYMSSFTYLHIECARITPLLNTRDGALVELHCSAELGMNMVTIQTIFPQVMCRPDLVATMLRTPLLLPVHTTYLFNQHKQVTWQASNANVVEALLHQFGNLDDVAVAAAKTAIQPNATLLEGPDSVKRS
ncbi:hypothetical protein H310_05334 [Aphanomyces invadans]|uniref:BZIP domain-containing protein n=1 Tax=Aphanomyces invadans TaxID=157072 RepID=A0A024UAF8_9STRA|nr:hypothetical protein H310_05334 [Aphanomyces invadans]ETW02857.1 hypothetical protein H310_05334 [Aphanomyces invadans]|eukprot:XP_008868241.1 hypothetical protein H310_05334 [Aphanomyces invadans]